VSIKDARFLMFTINTNISELMHDKKPSYLDLEKRILELEEQLRNIDTKKSNPLENITNSKESQVASDQFCGNQISEFFDASKQVMENECNLNNLINNLPGMAYRCRNENHWPMLLVSQGCMELTGYSSEDLLSGKIKYGELIHWEDRIQVWDAVQLSLKTNKPFEIEYRITCCSGEAKCLWERGIVVERPQNEPEILEGFITDITQRKNTEKYLRESEARYKAMFYENKAKMALIDPILGVFVDVNEATTKFYGYTNQEMKGKKVSEINVLTDEELQVVFNKALKEEINFFQFRHKLKNNEIRDVQIYSGKIYLGEKELLYSIIHDNTQELLNEKKLKAQNEKYMALNEELQESLKKIEKAQSEIQKAKERAEESDRLKSAFLANMSHEIRTPMNGIIGFSEMLLNPQLTFDKRKHYANIIIESGNQLLSLVNDILDISILEAAKLKICEEEVHVNDMLMNLFSFFKPQATSKGIHLYIYKDLPDSHSIIKTDKSRLNQIITNLLSNAFKFIQQGHIKLGYHLLDNNLRFFVEDTGIGIADDQFEKVFERFRQENTNIASQYGGTGLGLSISKKLVELLGGKIWVESEKMKGSTFYFTLPYNLLNTQKSNSISQSIENNSPKFTILIAEDEEINYLILETSLQILDVHILHAKDGVECIAMAKKFPRIDLILMDIKMPHLNGLVATQEIKKFRPDLPIIAETAYITPDDIAKAKQAGCDDHISKPLNMNDLINLIRKYMDKTIVKGLSND